MLTLWVEMFEGLGLGTRLAFLQLPKSWNWVPTASGVAYSVIAPLGMAIGLGTRETVVSELLREALACAHRSQSMTSGTASVVSGVLDSISAGILLYSATVELMVSPLLEMPRKIVHADNIHRRPTSSSSRRTTIPVRGRGLTSSCSTSLSAQA